MLGGDSRIKKLSELVCILLAVDGMTVVLIAGLVGKIFGTGVNMFAGA